MSNDNSNVIPPLEGLQNIGRIDPTGAREQKKKKQNEKKKNRSSSRQPFSQEQQTDEIDQLQLVRNDDDEHSIDYCA